MRVFPRTAMPVVKVTTISPVVATAGAVPRVVVRPTTSPALCDMRPLQSCGAKSSFALPRVQVAVPLSVKSVAPPPPLPVVRVVKPRAQTSARPPLWRALLWHQLANLWSCAVRLLHRLWPPPLASLSTNLSMCHLHMQVSRGVANARASARLRVACRA